jgi:ligand-binding SRPBCC domain-containing protein
MSRPNRLSATLLVHAPIETVFALATDVEEHLAALAHTGERVVPPGRTSGLLEFGDLVCFRARHFGLPWRMTARIVAVEAPVRFVDEQLRGPFQSLRHEHVFAATRAGTMVTDVLTWRAPFGVLGQVADAVAVRRHMLGILSARGTHLKRRAESVAHCRLPD